MRVVSFSHRWGQDYDKLVFMILHNTATPVCARQRVLIAHYDIYIAQNVLMDSNTSVMNSIFYKLRIQIFYKDR